MGGAEWLELLNTFGLPVVVLYLLVRGIFVTGNQYERLWKEYQDQKEQNRASVEAMQEKVIPAIVEANKLLTDVAAILRDRR